MVAMVIDAQAAARGALSARARPDLATREVMGPSIRVAASSPIAHGLLSAQ
jgi:hypothetical protein